MKKIFFAIASVVIFSSATFAHAQLPEQAGDPDLLPPEKFYLGEVVEILLEEKQGSPSNPVVNQSIRVKVLRGDIKGEFITIQNTAIFTINGGKALEVGQKVVVYAAPQEGEPIFYIADVYRLPALIWIVIIFFAVAIIFSRWKGVSSIIGLAVSILVIAYWIVPRISAGSNPLLIILTGALAIALVSIYLSHGFNKRTSVALASTLITLGLAAVMSVAFVSLGRLFGLGSEEAFYLQSGALENLNLKGLLLGGIILGALGVLDDITTAQSGTVDEIRKANPTLGLSELYKRGLSVGREHIASLVNTLFLAYAGASLPLFLFFTVNSSQPFWVTLNTEFLAEEVVRTMVGSIALILAVPITTILAAYYFSKNQSN